jgi:hypothetical protein
MDSSADQSDPPSGPKPEEPETSPMAAVPPVPEVVWPEDPFEADGHAADAEPGSATPQVAEPVDPPWTQQAFGKSPPRPAHLMHPPHVAPAADDPHTAQFPTQAPTSGWSPKSISEPSVGKTQPPPSPPADEAVKTKPPAPRATEEARDEIKTAPPARAAGDEPEDTKPPVSSSVEFKTAPPIPKTSPALPAVDPDTEEEGAASKTSPPVAATDDEEPSAPAAAAFKTSPPMAATHDDEPLAPAAADDLSESIPFEAEPRAQDPDSAPDLPVIPSPTAAPVVAAAPEPEPEPQPEPAPAAAAQAAPPVQPTVPTQPAAPVQPAAAAAAEPLPWPAAPKTANPPIPSWAPRLQHPGSGGSWPASSNTPTWAPQTTGQLRPTPPAVQPPAPTPPAPAAAHAPVTPPAPAAPAVPAAPAQPKPAWEVVQQEVEAEPAFTGPSPEDKSYAEWFAWAKRSGAPASACHAAAQGAFRALSTGQDMTVAVQWATLAMASPPGLVGASRQLYCAWFSLGNIDLKLPTQQAHAFATGAIQALESGADSMVAHQMGLAAAGITAR